MSEESGGKARPRWDGAELGLCWPLELDVLTGAPRRSQGWRQTLRGISCSLRLQAWATQDGVCLDEPGDPRPESAGAQSSEAGR